MSEGSEKYQSTSDSVARQAREFLSGFGTLLMSTVSAEGVPDASYAPFVRTGDNAFYVYVSELSRHTANLAATGVASILFLHDEDDIRQAFARRRLSFGCRVERVERDSSPWREVIDVFVDKFGDIMDLIRPLQDFQLFRLVPQAGVYVRGFAQAYRIEGEELESFREVSDVER